MKKTRPRFTGPLDRQPAGSNPRPANGQAAQEALQVLLEIWSARRAPGPAIGDDPTKRHPTRQRVPDAAALDFLADAIWRYLFGGGRITLDQALGLQPRRGQDHPLKRSAAQLRDYIYFEEIAKLLGLGFTVEEAAQAVADAQRAMDLPRWLGSSDVRPISAKTARVRFHAAGGVAWARKHEYFGAREWSPAEIKRYLSEFPSGAIPPRFL